MSKSIIHGVSAARRRAIVGRLDGGTTRVTAAELQGEDELAFAVRFLMDHYVYKRSKASGDISAKGAQEAVSGVLAALDNFVNEVAEPQGIDISVPVAEEEEVATPAVSGLGAGVIRNPFDYLAS